VREPWPFSLADRGIFRTGVVHGAGVSGEACAPGAGEARILAWIPPGGIQPTDLHDHEKVALDTVKKPPP
jgi:hypothetical protein